jgi:hypothetical protein
MIIFERRKFLEEENDSFKKIVFLEEENDSFRMSGHF